MNSLVAVGTLAAWGYSLVATFAPGLLPPGTVNVYYEAAAVIVTLILFGRWMEVRAKGRTSQAIQRLVGLQPRTARVRRDGRLRATHATDSANSSCGTRNFMPTGPFGGGRSGTAWRARP